MFYVNNSSVTFRLLFIYHLCVSSIRKYFQKKKWRFYGGFISKNDDKNIENPVK